MFLKIYRFLHAQSGTTVSPQDLPRFSAHPPRLGNWERWAGVIG